MSPIDRASGTAVAGLAPARRTGTPPTGSRSLTSTPALRPLTPGCAALVVVPAITPDLASWPVRQAAPPRSRSSCGYLLAAGKVILSGIRPSTRPRATQTSLEPQLHHTRRAEASPIATSPESRNPPTSGETRGTSWPSTELIQLSLVGERHAAQRLHFGHTLIESLCEKFGMILARERRDMSERPLNSVP